MVEVEVPKPRLEQFFALAPDLRYIFVGGKGGVGKTVVSAGIAYHLSEVLGKKTLLSSTNPVHSLSSLFEQDIWGKGIQRIDGTKNLYAIEVDISRTVDRHKDETRSMILEFLKHADIPVDPKPFIEAASTNPAFEESAMFEDMMDLMLKGEFDAYVFDTAPVAHTYRLLGMSSIYELWIEKMMESRREALSLRKKLSFRKEKIEKEIREDLLTKHLLKTREMIRRGREILTDPKKTAFIFVTLPLALPIAVIERFIGWVRAFNIPIGGVIVNGVIDKKAFEISPETSPYLVNKLREQDHYMSIIFRDMGDLVLGYVPLYDTEVVGVRMVASVSRDLTRFTPT